MKFSIILATAILSQAVASAADYTVKDGPQQITITTPHLEAAIRKSGIGRIEDVGAVVLESDGSLSVIARADGGYSVLDSVER